MESLIKVGSLDRFGARLALLTELERIMAVSASAFRAKESGQMSFFDASEAMNDQIVLQDAPYIDQREELDWERELLGLYVSDHPLSRYEDTLAKRVTHFSYQLGEAGENENVTVAGMVDRFRQHTTKNGKAMGFATLEDIYGKIDLVIFPRTWDQYYQLIEIDSVLQVEGRVDTGQGDPKILVNKITRVVLGDLEASPSPTAATQAEPDLSTMDDLMEEFLPDLPFDDPPPASDEMVDDVGADTDEDDDDEDGSDDMPGDSVPQQVSAQGEQKSAVAAPVPDMSPSDEPGAPAISPHQASPINPPDRYAGPEMDLTPPDMDFYNEPVFEDNPARHASYAAPVASAVKIAEPQRVAQSTAVDVQVQERPETPARYVMYRPALTKADPLPQPDQKPRCITISLTSTGNKNQDVLRLKRLHDILVSRPGRDKFAFRVRENGYLFEINFPNSTTGLTEPLVNKLENILGSNNIEILYLG
jgi:DNA polymerase-3 subunit alpha